MSFLGGFWLQRSRASQGSSGSLRFGTRCSFGADAAGRVSLASATRRVTVRVTMRVTIRVTIRVSLASQVCLPKKMQTENSKPCGSCTTYYSTRGSGLAVEDSMLNGHPVASRPPYTLDPKPPMPQPTSSNS